VGCGGRGCVCEVGQNFEPSLSKPKLSNIMATVCKEQLIDWLRLFVIIQPLT
jgi:hypothetical protein